MDARTRFETRTVGGLPVVQAFLEELGLAKIVDENREQFVLRGDAQLVIQVPLVIHNGSRGDVQNPGNRFG